MAESSRTPSGVSQPGSASLQQPDYWWYRARTRLLEASLGPYAAGAQRVLDVGSADGPSVGWLGGSQLHATVDVVTSGLRAGTGVCASALALPFHDEVFDVVGAFDVLEHLDPEAQGIGELARVLQVGGHLLLSVPAYEWAWSQHDVHAGHYRRYTRQRLLAAIRSAGLRPLHSSYAFASVFPFFVAERGIRRFGELRGSSKRQLTPVSPTMDRVLMGLSSLDERVLRRGSLPFGSSVLAAAVKEHTTSKDSSSRRSVA